MQRRISYGSAKRAAAQRRTAQLARSAQTGHTAGAEWCAPQHLDSALCRDTPGHGKRTWIQSHRLLYGLQAICVRCRNVCRRDLADEVIGEQRNDERMELLDDVRWQ